MDGAKKPEGGNNGAGRDDRSRGADRDAQRAKSRLKKQRADLEEQIEKHESERASLALEMNDPNFYLTRKDANEMIARYEWLGREIERLYGQLVNFEQAGGSPSITAKAFSASTIPIKWRHNLARTAWRRAHRNR